MKPFKMPYYLYFTLLVTLVTNDLMALRQNLDIAGMQLKYVQATADTIPYKKSGTEIYFGMTYLRLNASSEQIWGQPTSSDYDLNDTIFFLIQQQYQAKYKFVNQSAFLLGVAKNWQLTPKVSISYGVGLNVLSFEYIAEQEIINSRTLSEIRIIDPGMPRIYSVTNINTTKPYRDEQPYFVFENQTIHKAILLHLPLKLWFEISKNLKTGFSVEMKVPLKDEVSGVVSNYTKTVSQAHILPRFNTFGAIQLQYFLTPRFSTSLQYEFIWNSFMQADAQDYFTSYIPSKVNYSAFNLVFGYHLQ